MLTITPNTPYDTGLLSPTDLKISTASKGGVFNGGFELGTGSYSTASTFSWIGDEKYGWGTYSIGTFSVSYDTTVSHSGNQSMKLDLTSTTLSNSVSLGQHPNVSTALPGVANAYKYLLPIKASTTYRWSFWAKGNNLKANQFQYKYQTYTATATRNLNVAVNATPTDWVQITTTFTSGASDTFISFEFYNGYSAFTPQAATLWIDDITLEEVVSNTTFTGKVAEPIRPVLQAVTSTDNIDQSQLVVDGEAGLGYTNSTYVAQQFIPTKKYLTNVTIYKGASGGTYTGDITMSIRTDDGSDNPTAVILASYKILNATWVALSTGQSINVNIPCLLTSGTKYWIVLQSSTTDGTNFTRIKYSTTNTYTNGLFKKSTDFVTWSTTTGDLGFIQYYAKKSETFKVVANGIPTELKSNSSDGLLTGSVIDLDNGKYIYSINADFNSFANDVYSASVGGSTYTSVVINGWANVIGSNLQTLKNATARNLIVKVNTILPIRHLNINSSIYSTEAVDKTVQISSDNINYTILYTINNATDANYSFTIDTDLLNGKNVFYLKFDKLAVNDYLQINRCNIEADIDTSSLPRGLFYPIGQANQFTETVKLPSVATRVYYQAAKYNNEYGVAMPALEFTDGSAVYIGYVPLKLDITQETNPAVSILNTTTNYQASGTGSTEGDHYILNTGEYMTFTSTVAEIKVDYQVGKGTTAFTNITKNIYYLSSNGESNDATQDPSHQFNAILGVRQQGLVDRTKDIGDEIEYIRKELRSRYTPVGAFSDSTIQTFALTTVAYPITYNTNELVAGVYHDTVTNPSMIYITEKGVYRINFSACVEVANNNDHFSIWMRVNGVDVPRTNTVIQVTNANTEMVMTVDLFYEFKVGDYFELVANSQDGINSTIKATAVGTTPDTPACPSIVVNVNKIRD